MHRAAIRIFQIGLDLKMGETPLDMALFRGDRMTHDEIPSWGWGRRFSDKPTSAEVDRTAVGPWKSGHAWEARRGLVVLVGFLGSGGDVRKSPNFQVGINHI